MSSWVFPIHSFLLTLVVFEKSYVPITPRLLLCESFGYSVPEFREESLSHAH